MKALEDIVLLDLTHMLSGPYGAMLLTDLGAHTIKVEPPWQGRRDPGTASQGSEELHARNGLILFDA